MNERNAMLGVVFYTGAGRWVMETENSRKTYVKMHIPHILVKFKDIKQYMICAFNMNYSLKPYFNMFLKQQYNDNCDCNCNCISNCNCNYNNNNWTVDDVIERSSFIKWTPDYDVKPHINITNVEFEQCEWSEVDDWMFNRFIKQNKIQREEY